MSDIITKDIYIDSDVCSCESVLRTSAMMLMFQKIAGEHSRACGYGKEWTFDRGLFWVLVRDNVEVLRLPRYGETVTVRTWVGKPRLSLFPRFYDMISSGGEVLVKSSSTWAIMNAATRSFARQEEHGMEFADSAHGDEIPLKEKLPREPFADGEVHMADFSVPFSYLDVNRHMNNTRYLDLADDLLPSPADGKQLKHLFIELAQEIRAGDHVKIVWKQLEDGRWYMEGQTDKPCFKLLLEY